MKLGALVLIIIVSMPAGAAGETRYYRSNIIGMQMESVVESRLSEYPYVLTVEGTVGGEVRTLTRDGVEIVRWEIERDGRGNEIVRRSTDGELETVTIRDGGLTVTEENYSDGSLTEVIRHTYRNGMLTATEVYTPEGTIVSTDSYRRTPAGKLWEATNTVEGETTVSKFVYGPEGLTEEWHGGETEGRLLRYAGDGILTREVWSGDEMTAIEEFGYGEVNTSRSSDSADSQERYSEYDERGRPVLDRVVRGGILVEEVTYTYEGDLLSGLERRSPGMKETETYRYENDARKSVEISRNGVLAFVRTYVTSDEYFEDVYDGGEPVIRILYRQGIRVGETLPERE